jgi:hypothetical protein
MEVDLANTEAKGQPTVDVVSPSKRTAPPFREALRDRVRKLHRYRPSCSELAPPLSPGAQGAERLRRGRGGSIRPRSGKVAAGRDVVTGYRTDDEEVERRK